MHNVVFQIEKLRVRHIAVTLGMASQQHNLESLGRLFEYGGDAAKSCCIGVCENIVEMKDKVKDKGQATV